MMKQKLNKRSIKFLRKGPAASASASASPKGHKRGPRASHASHDALGPKRKGTSTDNEKELPSKRIKLHKLMEMGDEEELQQHKEDDFDEEVDEGGEAPQAQSIVKGKKGSHQSELDSLQQTDPDFYKFLQQHDRELLEFGEDDFDEEEDEAEDEEAEHGADDDDDDDVAEEGASEPRRETKQTVVTKELFDAVLESAMSGGIGSLRKVLSIFRHGCTPIETIASKQGAVPYLIEDPSVYEHVMTSCLKSLHEPFTRHVGLTKQKLKSQDILKNLAKQPKWQQLGSLVLSFFKSCLVLLSQASDRHLMAFVITSIEPYTAFLSPLPRVSSFADFLRIITFVQLSRTIMKALVSLWSSDVPEGIEEADLRAHAFLCLRRMAIMLPAPSLEDALKGMYIAYARSATSFNEYSHEHVLFMCECAKELYGLDMQQSYQIAFVYIRQLALHLRTAMMKKSYTSICTWQYLNCLKLWTRVLCAYPSHDSLRPLVFPLSQIISGVFTSSQSPRLIPYRLHLVSLLQQLAAFIGMFIPTAPKLLTILDCPEFATKPAKSADLAPNFYFTFKLPKDGHTKLAVQSAIVQEVCVLLQHDAEIYRYSVGWPEYTFITVRRLRGFIKTAPVPRHKALARAVVEQLEGMSQWTYIQRAKLRCAPKDIKDIEELRPADKAPMAERFLLLFKKHQTSARELITLKNITVNPFANGAPDTEPTDEPSVNELEAGKGVAKSAAKSSTKKKNKGSKKTERAMVSTEEQAMAVQDSVRKVQTFDDLVADWSD